MGTTRTPSEQAKFNRCVDVMARMILIHEANKAKSESKGTEASAANA